MKAYHFLLTAFLASSPVFAQTAAPTGLVSTGTTGVSRAPSVSAQNAPLAAAAQGVPAMQPVVQSPRNPMLPPPSGSPLTGPAMLKPEGPKQFSQSEQALQAAMARQGGSPTHPQQNVAPYQPDTPVLLPEDPVKANGKRIGSLNGKQIFKLEEAYYFETTIKKKSK